MWKYVSHRMQGKAYQLKYRVYVQCRLHICVEIKYKYSLEKSEVRDKKVIYCVGEKKKGRNMTTFVYY